MKKRFTLLLVFFTIINLSAQGVETITVPKGIVYHYAEKKVVEKAKALIDENITKGKYSILQDHLIVGPQLWKRFGSIERLQNIVGDVTFHVDDQELKGKMSQDKSDSKLIWDEFKKEVDGNYTIRKANEDELRYYWSVISFDIDEPLLIVETKNHNYILNLLKSNLKLLWLDEAPRFKAYQNGKEINSISKGTKETKLEKVILLSSDKEFKENNSIEDIQIVIKETESVFEELFKNSDKAGKIMVAFELKKENNDIQFAVRDGLDLNIMKEFEKRVTSIKYPNSKQNPLKLQLLFKVNSFDDTE